MLRTTRLAAVLCALAAALAGKAQVLTQVSNGAAVSEQTAGQAQYHDPCPLLTIAKGDHSGWGHDEPGFAGADFIIAHPHAWLAFWHGHTGDPQDPPPVDFEHQVVVVAVQGPQPTSGGPSISIVNVHLQGPLARFVIVDDERPGDIEEVSNPFHIVAMPRELLPPGKSISFQHVRPIPESGVVTGRVFADPPQGEPFPLPGAHVMLLRENQDPRHTMSGLDGSYFFVNVPPGEYILVGEHPAFEPVEMPIFVPPNTRVEHNLFLQPPPPEGGVVAGRVLGENPDGDPLPLPEALVLLFRDGQQIAHRWTNDQGVFDFHPLPPGQYVLVAWQQGYWPQAVAVELEPQGEIWHVFVLPLVP